MRRLAVLCVLVFSGCVGTADCGPDWFAVGSRDGRINAGSQAERYAARCGTPVDTARYDEGYREGFAQRPVPNW
ncbi:MAG: hypothetical protein ACREU1_14450 [Burkholderiales bacterium]